MKHLFTKILALIMLVPFMANAQGVTSSSISGKVLGSDGKGAIGAVVVAIHIPSNSKYGGRTSSDGTYNINGLRVGGPYTIKASIIGSGEDEKQNVFLKLGSNGINFKLNEKQNAISEVVVSAKTSISRTRSPVVQTTVYRQSSSSSSRKPKAVVDDDDDTSLVRSLKTSSISARKDIRRVPVSKNKKYEDFNETEVVLSSKTSVLPPPRRTSSKNTSSERDTEAVRPRKGVVKNRD
jgi:hypothetical protein